MSCLESLVRVSNNQFEICIHESGPKRELNLPSKYKYLFTEYKGIFHRAWAINRGVKILATGKVLILMDGDLIVNSDWMKEVLSCDHPTTGWGRILWINEQGTDKFLKTKSYSEDHIEKRKTPSKGSAAGAITIISTELFSDLGGIPEDFTGSWGGEDNAFWSKLTAFDYKFRSLNSEILHLYHSKSTPRVTSVQKKAILMYYWTKAQWQEYVKAVGDNWGLPQPTDEFPSRDFIASADDTKLTMAMLSWIRPEKLIETLTSLDEILTIPVNLTLMVQGAETLDSTQKRTIRELASRFHRSDVFFTQGNVGTGPARRTLQIRALRRFNTPYLNFADDDTIYEKGSVEAAIDLLDRDLSIGIVGIRYKPNGYKLDRYLNPKVLGPQPLLSSAEEVDSTGSASAIIRREVFDLCKIDAEYKLGFWDLDFCLQARSIGWKIVNLRAFAGMKAINNFGGSREYRNGRMNKKKINASSAKYKAKWGLVKSV